MAERRTNFWGTGMCRAEVEDNELKRPLFKQICPACNREFAGDDELCPDDGHVLIPLIRDPLIGTVLAGYYRIVSVIGRGGMGVVYKASDQLMDRVVAIKMLHSHLASDQNTLQRFQQEAKAASCLSHPNVVAAYDLGISELGQPFLVMNYVQGRSLSEVLEQEGPLSVERAINIFSQICSGLHHAHQKGVIHRDLKPGNLMLIDAPDSRDFVKIVDFGIAKLLPSSGKQMQQLTQTGQVFGSPMYMSPEQFMGQKLGPRSDIYSLGCVLYEAVTGIAPFAGSHILDTMHKHLNERPKPFDDVVPQLHLPERLETVVLRALEKEQDQRYQSMQDLKEDLDLVLKGSAGRWAIQVLLPRRLLRFRRELRRHPDLPAKVLTGFLCILILIGTAIGIMVFARSQQEAQWDNYKRAGLEAYRRGQLGQAEKEFAKAIEEARGFGSDDPRYIDSLKRMAWILEAQGRFDRSGEYYAQAIGVPETWIAKYHRLLDAGQEMELSDNFVAAQQQYDRLAQAREDRFGPLDPGLVEPHQNLARVYKKEGLYSKAQDEYAKVQRIVSATQGSQSLGVIAALADLGELFILQDRLEDAERKLEESLRLALTLMGKDSKEVARVTADLGEILRRNKRYSQAEERFRSALATLEKAGATRSPLAATIFGQYAQLLHDTGRDAEALQFETRARELAMRS